MEPFRTIVAAVDFSETSREVIKAAIALAQAGGGRICLVHVVPPLVHAPWVVEARGLDVEDVQGQWVAKAETQLADLAARERLDPRSTTVDVLVGPAAAEIVGYADSHRANVLVMGSHGHGVIRRVLLGSVVERVLREAGCPVMVVTDRAVRSTLADVRTMRAGGSSHAA
jgi:nucleotide-binding universal stress UspA family protein